MRRAAILVVVSLAVLGFGLYSVLTTWFFRSDRPARLLCEDWLAQPVSRWVELRGCRLDSEQLVLESEGGELESLAGRLKDVSTHVYATPPTWVAAWVPVHDGFGRTPIVHAAYRIESADLMKWLNALDRAEPGKREQLWADPVPLRRLVMPRVLIGRAEKAADDELRKVLGGPPSATLMLVTAGLPPEPEPPFFGLFCIIGGVALMFAAARNLGSSTSGPLGEQSAEQLITNVNVSDVKVELGALEQLREEERAARRSKRDADR